MDESNRMYDLITPALTEVQNIEDMLDELRARRLFNFAIGQQLDNIGDIVGVSRPTGMSDNDYTVILQQKVFFNISSGQSNAIIDYIKTVIGVGNHFIYSEPYSATILLEFENAIPSELLMKGVFGLKPIGVHVDVKQYDTSFFAFADENGHSTGGHGFLESNYDESHGYIAGKLAEAITIK